MNIAKSKLPQGKELLDRAEELGVSVNELYDSHGILAEPELQHRVIDAERAIRESRLWILALASAIASVVSAIAAWTVVLVN